MTDKHGNAVADLQQKIGNMEATAAFDRQSGESSVSRLREDLRTTQLTLGTKIDTCRGAKAEQRDQYRAEIDELKADMAEFGDAFCQRALAVTEARLAELDTQLTLCKAGDADVDYGFIGDLLEREAEQFAEIQDQNQSDFDHAEDKADLADMMEDAVEDRGDAIQDLHD